MTIADIWDVREENGIFFKTLKKYFTNNQQILEITYRGKKKYGYMKTWHRNGVLKKYMEYSNDKMHGVFLVQEWTRISNGYA